MNDNQSKNKRKLLGIFDLRISSPEEIYLETKAKLDGTKVAELTVIQSVDAKTGKITVSFFKDSPPKGVANKLYEFQNAEGKKVEIHAEDNKPETIRQIIRYVKVNFGIPHPDPKTVKWMWENFPPVKVEAQARKPNAITKAVRIIGRSILFLLLGGLYCVAGLIILILPSLVVVWGIWLITGETPIGIYAMVSALVIGFLFWYGFWKINPRRFNQFFNFLYGVGDSIAWLGH